MTLQYIFLEVELEAFCYHGDIIQNQYIYTFYIEIIVIKIKATISKSDADHCLYDLNVESLLSNP